MIDPKTGLEINNTPEYKDTLQSATDIKNPVVSQNPVQSNVGPQINLGVLNDYRAKLNAGPALEHTTTPQTPVSTVSNVSGGLSNLKVAPEVKPIEPIKPVVSTTTQIQGKPDYMSQADWDKIQTEGTKNIKDTYSSYNIAKGQYETNKNYYTNFDEKNNQYNNVLNSLQTAQAQNQNAPITDAQYQAIASQYSLTPDQVKNPLNIFSQGLQMTDEGKRKLGVSTAEQNINDATTQYERTKADLATKTQQTQDQFQQQVDDVQKQLTRNIDVMTAQGAWSGANKSSGYVQGIQNVAQDGQTTINRLKTLAEQAKTSDAKSVDRLTQDFNTGITRAKTVLDDQMNSITQKSGLDLNFLEQQYGLGSKTLTTSLEKIMQDMDSKTADAQAKYIANLKSIQGITSTNIDNFSKLKDLNDQVANKRTTELLANGGAILQNTSLTTLSNSVQNGEISPQKYADLKSYMLSGIQTALGKLGTLTEPDTQTIEHLIETGSTPAQVIAKMQETGRFVAKETFKPNIEVVGQTEDSEGNKINQYGYFDKEGNLVHVSSNQVKGSGTGSTGSDLYKQMTASTNPIGVYATGDMSGDRHAAIYKTAQELGLDSFVNKFEGTKITPEMINISANKYGVDPLMIASTMALDSSMGTAGKGARNNNPGNVGQFDSLDAQGITVKGYPTLQDGIDAVSNNLAKRQNALGITKTTAQKEYTPSDVSLLNKVLSGTATQADRTAMKKKGLTDSDADVYAQQQKDEQTSRPYQTPASFQDIVLNPKATAEQGKSKAYADRMNRASEALLQSEKDFVKSGLTSQLYQTNVPNALKSEEQQSMESNKQNFITAVLRQESGASISPTEFAKEEKKYFPQPGDTPKVVAEKQNFREAAIKGMYSQAGKDENGKPVSSYYYPKKIYEDGSYIKYDNAGNYNYIDKEGNESGWKPVGQTTQNSTQSLADAVKARLKK